MGDRLIVVGHEDSFYFSLPVNKEKNNKYEQQIVEDFSNNTYTEITRVRVSGEFGLFSDNHNSRSRLISESLPATPCYDLFAYIDLAIDSPPRSLIDRINMLLDNDRYVFLVAVKEPFSRATLRYIHTRFRISKKLVFLCTNAAIAETAKNYSITCGFVDAFSDYIKYGVKHYPVINDAASSIPTAVDRRDFMCLNYKLREPRKFILDQLRDLSVYDKGHISWGSEQSLENLPTMPLGKDLLKVDVVVPCFFDISLWTSSVYFELINEDVDGVITKGIRDEDYVMISEKIYRSIYNQMPFIIFGKPHTLKYLRALGYRTFDGLFDESYDDISDWRRRAMFIAQQIANFCNMSDDEKKQWHANAKDIAAHNYNHFMDNRNTGKVYYHLPVSF